MHRILRSTAAVAILAIIIAGCNDEPSVTGKEKIKREIVGLEHTLFKVEDFRQKVTALLPFTAADTTRKKGAVMDAAAGKRFAYSQGGYAPFWVEEHGVNSFAKMLLTDLDSLKDEGINPERYGLAALHKKFDALSGKGGTLDDAITFDTACTRAYLMASRDLQMGTIPVKGADSLWYHTNDSAWAAPALLAGIPKGEKYVPLAAFRSSIPFYTKLREAYTRYKALASNDALASAKSGISGKSVSDSIARRIIKLETPWVTVSAGDSMAEGAQYIRGFQEYYGLNPTGKTDSMTACLLSRRPDSVLPVIAANLERLRWLPQHLESQYVLVDIPMMQLFYHKGDRDIYNARVVVGKPARQTPVLNANMANVVFSPGWGVPPTILKNDVLPGIAKRGGNYLAKKGLHAFNRHGKMVSAGSVTAKNYRNFNFRQLPGARNALGEVKFNLPNPWDIYLHDTPHRDDFVKRYRAKSSGCIRVHHPKEFAQFILQDVEGRDFDAMKIDSIIDTRKTRFENLKTKIPVHILYLTAFDDDEAGRLHFLQDIYGRDKRVIAALARAGVI